MYCKYKKIIRINKTLCVSSYISCKNLGTVRTLGSVLGLTHISNVINGLGARTWRLTRFLGVT